MRTVAVVTGARSDYAIVMPVMRAMQGRRDLRLRLIVTGMHLSRDFGHTVDDIERDGFPIDDRVDMLEASDSPAAIATSIGRGTVGFARALAASRPELLLVAGDRFEALAAVTATLPFKVPVAHIHGGESTEGAIDEAIRHSITKMSHLHFVSTDAYGARVRQMGEEAWRVTVSGAPSLDTLRVLPRLTQEELERRIGLPLDRPLMIVTYHPVTLEYEDTAFQIGELLAALEASAGDASLLFTYPNADTYGRIIVDAVQRFVTGRPHARTVANLGSVVYAGALARAACLVGNSSSGIIEAASFRVPVVDIGNRQRGRIAPPNVRRVGYARDGIAAAIRQALAPGFRDRFADLINPYGDGHAADRIVDRLASVQIDDRLLLKRFAAA